MYIYLKNNESFKLFKTKEGSLEMLFGRKVCSDGSFEKLIEVPNETTNFPEDLKEVFSRASIVTSPNFPVHRMYGEYRLGDAVAKVVPYNAFDGGYKITLETSQYEGLKDMKTLLECLWAGTIVPAVPYDREQRKIHPLDVLKQLLSTRKLSWIQRFFLSMRMLAR